jgi:hypothetical protein
MTSYRYVVFSRGKQPTVDEVRQLQQFAGALANQFAWGTCRHDGRLAVAFDARAFDHLKASDAGFDALLARWTARGCETLDHLGFVKDAAALRPTPTAPGRTPLPTAPRPDIQERVDPVPAVSSGLRDAAKSLLTQESVARSLLGVQQTLDRYNAWQRFATAAPYLMMAVAAAMTLAFGFYVRDRLVHSGRERRQVVIERAVDESLPHAAAEEAAP